MKSLVIFESFFGNTEKVAMAIGTVLGEPGYVKVVRVADLQANDWPDADRVVIGSPTRGFQATPAVMNAIKKLPAGALRGKTGAAFDTRLSVEAMKRVPGFVRFMIGIFGYGAEKIGKAMGSKGAELALPPEGFYVEDSEGPLSEGELERAAAWATKLI